MSETSQGILFLCVANSARSQMAEGLARADRAIGREALLARFRTARDKLREKIAVFARSNEKDEERNA